MKTKTLAKRIASIVLAMTIVLSFALVNVSAIPADYIIDSGKQLTVNFDDQSTAGIEVGSSCSVALSNGSSEPAHSGNYSLKVSTTERWAKVAVKPENVTGSDWGFEKGAKYYVSFWTYSDDFTSGVVTGTNVGCPPYGQNNIPAVTSGNSGTAMGQWNKCWMTFDTTGAEGTQRFLQIVFSSSAANKVIYIDDVEIAQITGQATNDVPSGITASAKGYLTADANYSGVSARVDSVTTEATFGTAHYGEKSVKVSSSTAMNANSTGIYVNSSSTFGIAMEADTNYYLSGYVYSPADVTFHVKNVSNVKYLEDVTVPANTWTKVSALFNSGTLPASNANLLLFVAKGETCTEVYYDDFVFAKLTAMPAAATLSAGDVEYDYATNTAEATITSTVALNSAAVANVTAPQGVTVTSATLSADGATITVGLSGVVAEENYALTLTGLTDAFGRTVEDAQVTVSTPSLAEGPMTISSSSVADGATGVAPVKELYFKVPYALDEATVIASNFSIEGYGASIESVAKVADTEIKVTLDGVWPGKTYTLSVDGVANTSGGVLKDTITFTTKESDFNLELGFENMESIPTKWYIVGQGNTTPSISTAQVHTDSQSMMVPGQNDGSYKYGRVMLQGLESAATYKISFWWYSDSWKGNMSVSQVWASSTFPTANTTTTTGAWNYTEAVVTTKATLNGGQLTFWGMGEGACVYIDDLKVERLDTACQPTIRANGEYAQALAEGNNTIEFTINGGAKVQNVTAFVITYGENNRMLSATPTTKTVAASTDETFTLTVTKAAGVKTKVIVMDADTYAPLYDVIQ